MKEKICCPAMEHAIETGYVTWPITYNEQKERSRLTPIIHHPDRESGEPAFLLNRCPWCGVDVRINARTEWPPATDADLLAAAKELADVVDDLYRDGYVPSVDQTKRIRTAIAQAETLKTGGK